MPRGRPRNKPSESYNQPPGTSLESRENQLILLATNLAEKMLMEGTAPAQIVAHYLKLASTREKLEQERLRNENELAKAKTDSYKSSKHSEELYQEALEAFRTYGGHGDDEDYKD